MRYRKMRNAVVWGIATTLLSPGLVLAQADAQEESSNDVAEREAATEEVIDEILVVETGTLLELEASQMAKQVITLDSVQLAAIGEPDLARTLARIPQNFGGAVQAGAFNGANPAGGRDPLAGTNPFGRAANITGGASINLRGYGDDATLVLIDGKRMGSSGVMGGVNDISAIPMSAVERVEISMDGSSSIYGADAVGGVVNIIMKKDYSGLTTELDYGTPTSGGMNEGRLSLGYTKSWDKGSVTTSVGYYDSSELVGAEIDGYRGHSDPITSATTYRELSYAELAYVPNAQFLGSWDYDPVLDDYVYTPGDIYMSPEGISNPLASDMTPGERTGDQVDQDKYIGIHPDQQRLNVGITGRQDLSESVSLNFMLLYNKSDTTYTRSMIAIRTTLQGFDDTNRDGLLYPSGQYNPFADDITVFGLYPALGVQQSITDNESYTLRAGLDGRFDDNWNWEASLSTSRDDIESRQTNPINSTYNFRRGFSFDFYWNPWGDGTNNSQETLDKVILDDSLLFAKNTDLIADMFVRGDLFELPAGAAKLVVGGEIRRTDGDMHRPALANNPTDYWSGASYGINVPAAVAHSTKNTAFVAETFVPLLSDLPAVQQLSLTLSGRTETARQSGRYSEIDVDVRSGEIGETTETFGSSKYEFESWSAGLIWAPIDSMRIKLNHGKAMRAPRPEELYETRYQYISELHPVYGDVRNPLDRRWQFVPIERVSGGNPDLKPQELTSTEVILEFDITDSIGIAAKFFDNEYSNQIIYGGDIIDSDYGDGATFAAIFPDRVKLDGNGDLIYLDTSAMNLSRETQNGLDLQVSWSASTAIGDFTTWLNWTEMFENELYIDDTGLLLDPVEQVSVTTPENRARLNVSWTRGDWFAGLDSVYTSDTRDAGLMLADRPEGWERESHMYHNLQFGRSFSGGGILDNTTITLRGTNVTNERINTRHYYDGVEELAGFTTVAAGDARGRMVFLNIRKTFD